MATLPFRESGLNARPSESVTREVAQKILGAIEGLRFGSVEVVVHDGRVVQIERKEKVRLQPL